MQNGLYIVATPIGNLGDLSPRAAETLANADVIACEDTRIAKKLFALLNISTAGKKFIVYQNYNEEDEAQNIINLAVNDGKSIALVSDAGSPLISDPGYRLVRKAREQNVFVTVLPGCCALVCALQLSGLPTNRFLFAGFIPNKDKARADTLKEVRDTKATIVFYETAQRIVKTLTAAAEIFGNREMAVAREISKVYEECVNGTAAELIEHFSAKDPKGEMVLMIAPAAEKDFSDLDIASLLRQKMAEMPLKSAVKEMVSAYGLNKNEIYELALKIKNE
ncbi:MAG: 16S rRNA (cytidine(1402)-2'-O)-methyltransferase [Alphaproteobacteria bacterium]